MCISIEVGENNFELVSTRLRGYVELFVFELQMSDALTLVGRKDLIGQMRETFDNLSIDFIGTFVGSHKGVTTTRTDE